MKMSFFSPKSLKPYLVLTILISASKHIKQLFKYIHIQTCSFSINADFWKDICAFQSTQPSLPWKPDLREFVGYVSIQMTPFTLIPYQSLHNWSQMKANDLSFSRIASHLWYIWYFLSYKPNCTVSFNRMCTSLKNVENIRIFNWMLCLYFLTYGNVIYIKLKLMAVALHRYLQMLCKLSRFSATLVCVQVMLKIGLFPGFHQL